MGTDIYMRLESRVNNNWEFEGELDILGRNYNAFYFLAGVRGELAFKHLESKGIPGDLSKELEKEIDHSLFNNHSFSYLTKKEIVDSWNELELIPIKGMIEKKRLDKIKDQIKSKKIDDVDWELLYPYCSITSECSYVRFELNVPKKVVLRENPNLINKLDDNQRIVFWFD